MPAQTASWAPTHPMPCTAVELSGTSAWASSSTCGCAELLLLLPPLLPLPG